MSATTNGSHTQVTCPECGTITTVSATGRGASDFCPSCDYPLFWAGSGGVNARPEASDGALFRAPGTSGSTTPSALVCPACGEHNPTTGVACLRCGADLHPAPPPAPEPPAPPQPIVVNPPAQIVECSHWPSWAVATIASLVTAVVVVLAFVIWG
ncbi:hypothetical protein [Pseudactinotalea sp.]|uniref:hypothetical protein n=1 Tax=Pseudactinotalea sp. TaxID=1926260 RepID=UPI003B3AFA0F